MLSTNLVLLTALAYVALLFALAFASERWTRAGGGRLLRSPLVYTLSISVYCTSWTFYGAVGSAARNGLEFLTIYLGPTLVFVGWWLLLRKLVRIGHAHRITSIADLLSSRYGKSIPVAVMVTVIAVIGTTPYIALQLQAVTASFQVVAEASTTGAADGTGAITESQTALWVALAMAVFTILFGTRNLDADEHHPGVVAAIAFEAIVKLVALLAVGLFVIFAMGGGIEAVFAQPAATVLLEEREIFGTRWAALTFLSATAIICLPRQFQVTVVENADERNLRVAGWLFPLYLMLICLCTLPIAIVGLSHLPLTANPDMYVLTLPLAAGENALALLAFIGGFSSATSMVIVASIALSIMVSNHVVVPLALRLPWVRLDASGDIKDLVLTSRRISIGAILLLGFLYYRLSANVEGLASMGLIAFAGVAQFLPSLLGGLYWRNATARGALAGLAVGFALWFYTLLLPSFEVSGGALSQLLELGPGGIGWLRPQALFGTESSDPLLHALAWSLGANTLLFVVVSLFGEPEPLERLQSALFVDVFRHVAGNESRVVHRSAAIDELYVLAQRILGRDEAFRLFADWTEKQGLGENMPRADAAFISHLERRLTGSIGAASAHVLVSQVATGETISLDEVIKLVDETQQVIEYSHELERQSAELERTAAQLRSANERLRELDAQKDDFLSQVSHELRTPMTSIRSFSEILREAGELDPERRRHFVSIIHEESLRLTRLLDEILDLTHLERGDLNIGHEPVTAAEAIEGAVETCRGIAEANGVRLRVGKPLPSAVVMADRDRLRQVFINLVSNAIKYNASPDPWVSVQARVVDGTVLEIDVADNGPGVPREDRERIFQKFSRGWANTRERSPARAGQPDRNEGTGLGLAISRSIVTRLNGQLTLAPSDGSGARFVVRLPIAPGHGS